MFAGIYYGGMYGGSTTSILLNTPGESSSVVTAIEGHKMAKAGRAAQALATAAIGSFIAGTIGTVLLVVFAPVVVKFAVSLGNPSYFAIMVLALFAVTAVLGSSRLRGFCALGLGLTIGLVGTDPVSGQQRLTFGLPLLVDGIDVVVVAVAIFAVGEALWVAAHLRRTAAHVIPVGQPWMGKRGLEAVLEAVAARHGVRLPVRRAARRWRGDPDVPLLRHREAALQAPRGVRPRRHRGRRRSRRRPTTRRPPARWCRCCRWACPTNATAAVMLAAFTQYGIQPGPLLFEREPHAGLGADRQPVHRQHPAAADQPAARPGVGPAAADPAALPVRRHRVLRDAGRLLGEPAGLRPGILLVLGLLGFMMRRYGLPVLPLILGVILGPRLEKELRTSLQLSDGHISGLWSEPVAVVVYVIVALVLLWPLVTRLRGVNASRTEAITEASADDSAEERADEGGAPMSVVVGYVPTREGESALEHAVDRGPLARHAGWWW